MKKKFIRKYRVAHYREVSNRSVTDVWADSKSLAEQYVTEAFPGTTIDTSEIIDGVNLIIN